MELFVNKILVVQKRPQNSGNSEKYKGKIRKQDISVFVPKNNFVGYLRR